MLRILAALIAITLWSMLALLAGDDNVLTHCHTDSECDSIAVTTFTDGR